MTEKTYICPNCGGKGCPICQNSGKVTLSDQEVAELQKLATRNTPLPTQTANDYDGTYPNVHEDRKVRGQIAGIFTLIMLAAVAVSGFLSWFYTKTFRPFLQFWALVIAIALLKPVSSLKFFQKEKVKDYLGELEEQGVKFKLSPLYPLI